MSNEKPEALELADIFENLAHPTGTRYLAATELRRIPARIQELEAHITKLTTWKNEGELEIRAWDTMKEQQRKIIELEKMLEAVGAGCVTRCADTQGKDHFAQDRDRLLAQRNELLESCKSLLTLTQIIANNEYEDIALVEFEIFSEITKSTRRLVLVDELAKARAAIAKAEGV